MSIGITETKTRTQVVEWCLFDPCPTMGILKPEVRESLVLQRYGRTGLDKDGQ